MRVHGFLKMAAAALAFGGVMSTAQAGDIEFNGFGSLYYGQSPESELLAPMFTDNKADFSTLSLFGLNVTGTVNEKVSIAAQLIAASQAAAGNWGMTANWAYLNYKPTDSVAIKMGRQLFPIFIGSEYDKVGQLLPYRRIPGLSTLSPFSGFNGLSAAYTLGLTDTMKLTVSAFGGRPNYELTASALAAGYVGTSDELVGGTITLDGDGFRVRAMYNTLRAQLTNNGSASTACKTPACEARVEQYSFGYRFDKYNFVSWGEIMNRTGKDGTLVGTTPYLDSLKGGYVLVGYRMGDWMPRFTYTKSDAKIGVGTGGFDANSFGVNYAFSPSATFKLDYETYKGMSEGVYGMTRKTGSTKDTTYAVYAGVDFIF